VLGCRKKVILVANLLAGVVILQDRRERTTVLGSIYKTDMLTEEIYTDVVVVLEERSCLRYESEI
jgi:hypothetical protein